MLGHIKCRRRAQRAVLHLNKVGQQELSLSGSPHFTPKPFLAEAGGITNSHRLLSMLIDNYQYYHTNGKTGACLLQGRAHVAVTELLLSLTHPPGCLQGFPWCAFLRRGVTLGGEEGPERAIPPCCTPALPKSTTEQQRGETQDPAPPAPSLERQN